MTHECLRTDFEQQIELSPIQREILQQYQRLAIQLYKLSDELQNIHKASADEMFRMKPGGQSQSLLQNLRGLERKSGLVNTLFKTAVYSLIVQGDSAEPRDDASIGYLAQAFGSTETAPAVRQLESDDETIASS